MSCEFICQAYLLSIIIDRPYLKAQYYSDDSTSITEEHEDRFLERSSEVDGRHITVRDLHADHLKEHVRAESNKVLVGVECGNLE